MEKGLYIEYYFLYIGFCVNRGEESRGCTASRNCLGVEIKTLPNGKTRVTFDNHPTCKICRKKIGVRMLTDWQGKKNPII